MAAKMVVGSIVGLGVLAGGAVLAGRLGTGSDELFESTSPTSSAQHPIVEETTIPSSRPDLVLDHRDGAETDGAFSLNDRGGFQVDGGKFAARDKVKADMLTRFDTDGDGVLSEAETLAAKETYRAERDARRQQWLLEKYDADGDGVLSEEERAQEEKDRAAREEKRLEREAEIHRQALAANDADGDGELSEAEKQAGREARTAYMKQQHEAMTALFDEDQNGQMSEQERSAMHEAMGDMFAQMKFVRSFDSNGDHAVTIADMPAYMDLFAAGDALADVDWNGVVNESDLAAFQKRVLAPIDPRLAQAMGWFDNAPPMVDGMFGNVVVMSTVGSIGGGDIEVKVSGGEGTFVIKGGGQNIRVNGGEDHVFVIETIDVSKDD